MSEGHRCSLKHELGHSAEGWVEHCVAGLILPGVGLGSISGTHPTRATPQWKLS